MAFQAFVVRVYEDPGRSECDYRVLVDRLWPRGKTVAALDMDEWAKSVAPSTQLRKWYSHDSSLYEEFSVRYRTELGNKKVELLAILESAESKRLVLLTAAKDVERSSALVLLSELRQLKNDPMP